MKTQTLLILLLVLCCAVLGLSQVQQRQQIETLMATLEASEKEAVSRAEEASALRQLLEPLQQKLDDVTQQLGLVSAEKLALSTKLGEREAEVREMLAEAQAEAVEVETRAALKKAVPAPTEKQVEVANGRMESQWVFPQLLRPDGSILEDGEMTFRNAYGSRMVFARTDGTPVAYEIGELHQGTLEWLEIDPTVARQVQKSINERKARLKEQAHKAYLAKMEADRKMAIEMAKIAETRRQAQQKEMVQRQELEIERMKAEAAVRAADAAMEEARRPAFIPYVMPQTVVQTVPAAPNTAAN